MTDRRKEPGETIPLLTCLGVFAAVVSGLAAAGRGSAGSVHGALEKAVASIDPGTPGREFSEGPGVDVSRVVVAGIPAGFFVRVDGLSYPTGEADELTIPAEPGSHRVEIVNRDGEAWVARVDVPPGGAATARPELVGEIAVECASPAPGSGTVYLDGRSVGPLPAFLDGVPVGTHNVEIRSGDQVVWQTSVAVRDASVSHVEVPSDSSSPQN